MLTPFRCRSVSHNLIFRFEGVHGAAKAKEDYKTTKVSQIPSSRFYSDVTINPSIIPTEASLVELL